MSTFVLIHGAAGSAWDWHLVAPELRARGHDVVAVDLPCEDDSAGFPEYADTVVRAIGDRTDLVVVAHSLGGFTAPLVCTRVPVAQLVLVTATIPAPGEAPADWSANTGQAQAKDELARSQGRPTGDDEDPVQTLRHDMSPELAAEAMARLRVQSDAPMRAPWPLPAWPDVPTRYLLCRDDRLFPADFIRRHVRERLGIVPDEIDGGHHLPVSRPIELVGRLISYLPDRRTT